MSALYPDLPGPRTRALVRDGLTLLLLAIFAWLGLRLYHDVDKLAALGTGVEEAGGAVRSGFDVAASAASAIPLAGDAIAGALRAAAGATGGNIVSVGQAGVRSAHHLAVIVGLLVWLLPSLLLLSSVLPRRAAELRRLRHLRLAQHGPDAVARRRLLALRSVLTLDDEELLALSPDPAGDLLAGHFEALADAALEAGGVRPVRGG